MSRRNTKVFYLLQHMVRCSECGYLMGGSARSRTTTTRNGKTYTYEMDPPRRYFRCIGYHNLGLRCRPKPMIRAERLETLVWDEVKRVLSDPGFISTGIESLDTPGEGGGLADKIALAERESRRVLKEDERAIGLYVKEKITEE